MSRMILGRCRAGLALTAAALLLAGLPAADPGKERPRHRNRLARETSPYLLQHAHNPVDWYPWGEEAFARAKKEGKLVFLSIGYSSCHWCHVMERESFANEEVAKLLNRHFVCVKVDREERPDIDQVYMTAYQVIREHGGGWPLSLFLTADGKPVFGGTYWPPDDKEFEGRKVRGFKSWLNVLQEAQAKDPRAVQELADANARKTTAALAGFARGRALVNLDRDLVAGAVQAVQERFDKRYGGFGNPAARFQGTKFPLPPYLLLLQHEAARGPSKDLDEVVAVTLDHMARGGIYDQLGGGFHRYSTERTWTVPHFEKMLYDNAQLLEVYANAYRRTKKPEYARVLRQTLAFVAREMTAPAGGFYSALDADAAGAEGRFYVWTAREIDAVLKDRADADLFKKVYGADGPVNFESKYHILVLPKPLAEVARELKTSGGVARSGDRATTLGEEALEGRLAGLREKLLDARAARPRPFRDTKILTAWNGAMIAGQALAGQALGEKRPVEDAARAAGFVLRNLRTPDGRLLRAYGAAPGRKAEARLNGYLDDYAYLVHGLLCLHDVTGDRRWLTEARALTDTMVKHHGDKEGGAFFYTSGDHEKLFARSKDQYDGAQPSANSVAAANLVRLWVKTGEDRYARLAEKTFQALAGPLKLSPTSLTALADALGMYLDAKQKR